MAELEGGCSCGAIRYRMTDAPIITHCCHCKDCQRQTGSAFVINALIEADRVETQGDEPIVVTMPTDSGRPHDISRCSKCQTALWSTYGGRKFMRFLRVGSLDDPSAIEPDLHIFTRSKLPWVGLPPGARAFEVYYDMQKEWPAQSLERVRIAREAAEAS
jgi:hypothetical protein